MLNSSHENPIQRGPGKRSGRTKVRRPLRQLQFENLERRELLTACLAAVPSAQSFTGTIGVSALLAGNNQHSGIGLVSAPSAAAASRSGLFAARAPAAPVLRATAVSGTQVNLSWNSVSGASGYLVDVWLNGSWMQLGSVGSGATGCSVTGLSPGTTYYFDVGAYNAAGTSWANYRSVTTIASLAPPPPRRSRPRPHPARRSTSRGTAFPAPAVTWSTNGSTAPGHRSAATAAAPPAVRSPG